MHKYYIIILGVQDDANIQNKDIIAFQTNREHHMLLPSFVENIFHGCLLISPQKMDGCDVDFSGQYYEIRRDIAMKGHMTQHFHHVFRATNTGLHAKK